MTEVERFTEFEEDPDGISVDDVYDALSNDRRRAVLAALARRDERVELEELAHEVATSNTDDEPTPETRLRVEHSLYHVHAPRLDDAGLVEFDPEGKTIAPREGTRVAWSVLEELSTSA